MRIAVLPSDCLFYFLDTLLLHVPVSSQGTMPGRTCGNTWPSPTGCIKKYAGDVFTDIQLDEGLHFIVDKDVTVRRE